MYNLMKLKLNFLEKEVIDFLNKIEQSKKDNEKILLLFKKELERLEYDEVYFDHSGNIIGIINGLKNNNDILLLSHIFEEENKNYSTKKLNELLTNSLKSNIKINDCDLYNSIAYMYSGALLKRSIIPLEGKIIFTCITNSKNICLNTKCLFEKTFKNNNYSIDYVLLSQPTNLNIFTGNKGRFEYKVNIKVKLEKEYKKKIKSYEYVYPAINILEAANKSMPKDFLMGQSSLKITNIDFNESDKNNKFLNFEILVDRLFIPEESPNEILNKARNIVSHLYNPDYTEISTFQVDEKIKSDLNSEIILKDVKPWRIESNNPFVLSSIEALKNVDIIPDIGCWHERITEGSYTYNELKLNTIGFGAGDENLNNSIKKEDFKKCILGLASIIQNTIGIPIFGWTSDEI